jgi:SAM-dependent methyltransferase
MSVYESYAKYYDRLYPNKDYAAEVEYVEELIRHHGAPKVSSVLDLGCGTGRHAIELARRGHSVHGIDVSPSMVKLAEAKKSALPTEVSKRIRFSSGDVRNVRVPARFDVVLALFHVASYQVSNDDFLKFLITARSHLGSGGVLVFDFWYGPAVLSQRPETRVRRIETSTEWLVRIAEAESDYKDNIVTIKYEVICGSKETGLVTRFDECHRMRFLFLPEVRLFADSVGIEITQAHEWMESTSPTEQSWSACVVAKPTVIEDCQKSFL